MKALTVSQPFAALIASGEKWVENRTWDTRHRGPLAIHAGKGSQYLSAAELREYPTGCVVATAQLVACVWIGDVRCGSLSTRPVSPGATRTMRDLHDHDHTEGPWCWVLEDIQPLDTPIKATGSQGLWDWITPEEGGAK